jgi:lysophospholipase L1-like esterase
VTIPSGTSSSGQSRVVFFLAGLHFIVVGLLIADLASTWALSDLSRTRIVLLAVAVLWLAAGALFTVRIGRNSKLSSLFEKALVSVNAVVVVLAVLEIGLQLVVPDPSGYLRPPNVRYSSILDEELMPGVRGVANFTTNEWGLRGPSVESFSGKPNLLKIIAVGGSTTLCEFLDDSEEWPQLSMQELNRRQNKRFVYVANAGANGHNTADHLELLKRYPVMKNADVLIFLIGFNDFTSTLAFGGRPSHEALAARASTTSFTRPPQYPFYTRFRLHALVSTYRSVAGTGPNAVRNERALEWYAQRRRTRARGPTLPMPDLTVGLQEYQNRIRSLGEHCRSAGQRCVFLTQPTVWRSDLTPAEEALLFSGWTGPGDNPKGFIRAAELAHGISEFNEALLTECRTSSLECYDLASAIPKDTTAFYDDGHFNEGGARLVAEFVTSRLLNAAPFQD